MENLMNNSMTREYVTMNDVMNKIFERHFAPYDYTRNGGSVTSNTQATPNAQNGYAQPTTAMSARLPLDAQATEDAFIFTAYLPGVRPENVEITFEKDELTIKGQFPGKDEANHYIKSELFHGSFARTLTFSSVVNADAIEASFENGVLTLRVPKAEEAKPKKIAISAK